MIQSVGASPSTASTAMAPSGPFTIRNAASRKGSSSAAGGPGIHRAPAHSARQRKSAVAAWALRERRACSLAEAFGPSPDARPWASFASISAS